MKFIRSIIERMSRDRVITRHLPSDFHRRPILVSPDSALKFLKWNWAETCGELLRAADRFVQPGDYVWDIGANVGVFSVAAADKAGIGGGVLAVEADPFLGALINRTIALADNHDIRLKTLCAAISEKQGLANLLIANRGRSSNSLADVGHRSQADGVRFECPVATFKLDDLLTTSVSPPKMIKVDVEGAEILVLKGAESVEGNPADLLH